MADIQLEDEGMCFCCGPRNPIQLTPVPVKVSVARLAAAKPNDADPPLHGYAAVKPSIHELAGV